MTVQCWLGAAVALTALIVRVSAQSPASSATRGADHFATVDGVRLHYVDWGGSGEPMLFLVGGGNGSAHTFDTFAPRFTDRFHVLGLTRRGQGLSDKPATGYDTDTLARDIAGFLDATHIRRVILVGHSIAGAEMTRFAGTYPQRTAKLVYLDAANDYKTLAEISAEAHFTGLPEGGSAATAIAEGAAASHPDYGKIRAPALALIETCDKPLEPRPEDDSPAYRRYLDLLFERGFWWANAKAFQSGVKRGTVVTLPDCNHFFYRDPEQAARAERTIRTFLAQP